MRLPDLEPRFGSRHQERLIFDVSVRRSTAWRCCAARRAKRGSKDEDYSGRGLRKASATIVAESGPTAGGWPRVPSRKTKPQSGERVEVVMVGEEGLEPSKP